MMTSSNGNIFRITGPLCGEFTGLRWIPLPAQRPVTRSFDVFFDLCPIKQLSKHSRGWWFETLSGPLWRHCNGIINSNSLRHIYILSWMSWQCLLKFTVTHCTILSKLWLISFLFITDLHGTFLEILHQIYKYSFILSCCVLTFIFYQYPGAAFTSMDWL